MRKRRIMATEFKKSKTYQNLQTAFAGEAQAFTKYSYYASKAKKDGYEYLQYIKYAKFDSKEEIEVYFTSNFTENKVYKIIYNSRIASITGNSPKAIYIRNIKVYDFWKKINKIIFR